MNTQEELIQIKEKTDMNWRQFADYFGIPYRTMQDWYLGNRRMPDYLLHLMVYKLEMEQLRARKESDNQNAYAGMSKSR